MLPDPDIDEEANLTITPDTKELELPDIEDEACCIFPAEAAKFD